MHHVLDISLAIASVLVALVVLAGWGAVADAALRLTSGRRSWSDLPWVGLVAVVAAADTVHLFLPLDWKVGCGVVAIGACGSFRLLSAGAGPRLRSSALRWRTLLGASLALALLAVLCSRSMATPTVEDSGLYHFQSIRWLNEHAITPGLGNLHGRLAFNQSYFSFVALFNVFPLWNRGYAVAGVLLVTMAALTLVEAHLERRNGGWWLVALLAVALAYGSEWLSSPTPDGAIAVLEVAAFIKLLQVLGPDEGTPSQRETATVLLLCCLMACFKLSAAMFALTVVMVVLAVAGRDRSRKPGELVTPLALCGVLSVLHAIRGYLLSGMPLYPSTWGALWSLDWAVTPIQARAELDWIQTWARDPGLPSSEVVRGWDWLPRWIARLNPSQWRIIQGTGALVGANLLLVALQGRRYADRKWLLLYLPLASSVALWFFTAPGWRFLGSIPWLTIALSGWLCLRASRRVWRRLVPARAAALGPWLLLLAVCVPVVDILSLRSCSSDGWQSVPTPVIESRTTGSGLRVNVPATGAMCWDAPLPCATHFDPDLRLRGALQDGDGLGAGFSMK